MKRSLCGLVALGLAAVLTGQANAQPNYVFTTLDGPGSNSTLALGISNAGQVVGRYIGADGAHGILWSGGQYTTLNVPGAVDTIASGINNAGQVVGYYDVGGPGRGFLLSGGRSTLLDVPQAAYTFVYGINDSGQAVGSYLLAAHAGGYGFLYSGGNYTTLDVPGSVPASTSAFGINNLGQVVGSSSKGFFLLSDGIYTTLGVPGPPQGVNDLGQIVGSYRVPAGPDEFIEHGFLLSGGNYTTLDVPGGGDTHLLGINHAGQIVGWYLDRDGVHGFLATPTPEPRTLLLLGIATLALVGWKCRRPWSAARSRRTPAQPPE